MRTIMTLYVLLSSIFPQSFRSFCTNIYYIDLQIFHTRFFKDNIHSMRCSSAKEECYKTYLWSHVQTGNRRTDSLAWPTTAVAARRLTPPSCRVAPVPCHAPPGARHTCIKARRWMNKIQFLRSQLYLSNSRITAKTCITYYVLCVLNYYIICNPNYYVSHKIQNSYYMWNREVDNVTRTRLWTDD
jgi:hypothetical protein